MWIAGILLLLLSSGEYVSVNSSVDGAKITVGDPIAYTLTVTREESVKVELPPVGVNLGGFEIRDYHSEFLRNSEMCQFTGIRGQFTAIRDRSQY